VFCAGNYYVIKTMDHPTYTPVDRFALVALNAFLVILYSLSIIELYGLPIIAGHALGWFGLGYITLAPMVLLAGVCAYGAWAAYRDRSGAAAIATFGALVYIALAITIVFMNFMNMSWR
jgi:hypothetical protein